jgi:hypothetical protein
MWVLCGRHAGIPGEFTPFVYKGKATAWFTSEGLGRAFVAGLPLLAQRDPFLLELSGLDVLRRFALELLQEGVEDLYIDLSPQDSVHSERLEEFLRELDSRLRGEGESTLN